jgi:hypothetical protein
LSIGDSRIGWAGQFATCWAISSFVIAPRIRRIASALLPRKSEGARRSQPSAA